MLAPMDKHTLHMYLYLKFKVSFIHLIVCSFKKTCLLSHVSCPFEIEIVLAAAQHFILNIYTRSSDKSGSRLMIFILRNGIVSCGSNSRPGWIYIIPLQFTDRYTIKKDG